MESMHRDCDIIGPHSRLYKNMTENHRSYRPVDGIDRDHEVLAENEVLKRTNVRRSNPNLPTNITIPRHAVLIGLSPKYGHRRAHHECVAWNTMIAVWSADSCLIPRIDLTTQELHARYRYIVHRHLLCDGTLHYTHR